MKMPEDLKKEIINFENFLDELGKKIEREQIENQKIYEESYGVQK